jgi:Cu/Ag efflux pump CusA
VAALIWRPAREHHQPVVRGGGYERQQEVSKELAGAFVVSALLVFLLLYIAFRSVWQALLIVATIPMALAGGFIALWITGATLNVSSVIGLLAHFGLSVQISSAPRGTAFVTHCTLARIRACAPY